MASKFVRLIRESDPPAGILASPTPQYWDRETEAPGDVEGMKGAPFAVLLGPNGQPISTVNRLPVSAEVSGEVGVTGTVDVSDNADRQLGKVTLTGQLQGLADDRPDPGDVDIGTTYWSVDSGDVSVSTGTKWRTLGTA